MISAVVLAAGVSRRMGRPKLLLPFGDKTIIEHVVDHALASQAGEVIVVVGACGADIRRVIGLRKVTCIDNPRYAQGQAFSVAAGAAAVCPQAQGILFLNGDQPLVSSVLMDRLIAGFELSQALIASHMAQGPPIVFSIRLRLELMQLTGDAGGRPLLSKYQDEVLVLPIDPGAAILDVDTPHAYQQALYRLRHGAD